MKTPDEIKKGLECCISDAYGCNEKCPYFNSLSNGVDCAVKMHADALTYIQQLEAANAELLTKVKQLETKCHKLERERDSAVVDLAEVKDCLTCKHSANCKIGGFDCYHCNDKDCPCLTCQYEWRGVKEE